MSKRRAECGAALLEMALVLPLILFVFFGISSVAKYGRVYLALNKAVRTAVIGAAAFTTKTGDVEWCYDIPTGQDDHRLCRIAVLKDRFQKVFNESGLAAEMPLPDIGDGTIQTVTFPSGSVQVLTAKIDADYDTRIPFFRKIHMKVSASAAQRT